jgi:hypothetical protein
MMSTAPAMYLQHCHMPNTIYRGRTAVTMMEPVFGATKTQSNSRLQLLSFRPFDVLLLGHN